MSNFQTIPITLKEANAFIKIHHRHHSFVRGCVFVTAVTYNKQIVAVATVGRPLARHLDDKKTLEITRICSTNCYNSISFLLSKIIKISSLLGYAKIITYILESETGSSLLSAGFIDNNHTTYGRQWNNKTSNTANYPLCNKKRFSIAL